MLEAGQVLCDNYPDLRTPIQEALALHDALLSTTGMRKHARRPAVQTPQEFGPPCEGGPRYAIRELLGAGAAGDVYLGVDRLLSDKDGEALVAIKVLRLAEESELARQRLADEATRARRVDHPNVVRVLDRGITETGEDFVVMEYAPDGTLVDWRDGAAQTPTAERVAEIVTGVARGVHAIHAAGLVHCDLKPDNIVLGSKGKPKIADFGLALRGGDAESMAGSNHPLGNLAFMSPEQFRMEDGALTPAADIYALGGLLYWLLTGQLPNGESRREVSRSHRESTKEPRPPFGDRSEIPIDRDLEAICRRALHPDPAERYESASMLADDLTRWRRREPIAWTKPSLGWNARLWIRRRPGQAVLAALLTAALVGGAVVAGRLSTVAERRALEAELIAERLEKREGDIARSLEGLYRYIELRKAGSTGKPVGDTLLTTGPFLFFAGSPQFAETAALATVDELHTDLLPKLIERVSAKAGPRSVEALIWRTVLGFSFLRAGMPAEAERVLNEVASDAEATFVAGDPWLDAIEALDHCAAVNRRWAMIEREGRSPSAEEGDEMVAELEAADRLLADRPKDSGFRKYILDRLEMLKQLGDATAAAPPPTATPSPGP